MHHSPSANEQNYQILLDFGFRQILGQVIQGGAQPLEGIQVLISSRQDVEKLTGKFLKCEKTIIVTQKIRVDS